MPVTKNAAFRYRIIDSCLRNPRRRYPNIEDIQEKVTEALNLGSIISISSLHKDMKAMRDHFSAPIKFDRMEGGYYYEDEHFSLNAFPLTHDEITALDLSVSFLKQIKYSGFFSDFESAIDKIISGFRISKIEGFAQKKIIITEEPTADTGIRWLENIYIAILMKESVVVDYQKFNATESRIHHLSPYLIREYRNRWYVTGYSELTEGLVTLALDRVQSIHSSSAKYRETPTFNQDHFLKHAFGITSYADADPSTVKLLFNENQRGYVESKPIHPTQRIQESSNEFVVEMECFLTPELEMYILSLGENVKVLAPDELARRVRKRIEAMTYLYPEF